MEGKKEEEEGKKEEKGGRRREERDRGAKAPSWVPSLLDHFWAWGGFITYGVFSGGSLWLCLEPRSWGMCHNGL